ncbi:MAG: triose-phosphate isomerase, partial [Candidatus Nanopelagicales bacterium]
LDVRREGRQVEHVLAQVVGGLEELSAEQVAGLVIAYEPVWAIGTGEVATPEDAQEVCSAIRSLVADRYDDPTAASVRLLYGGSVKVASVAGIMAQPDVDGCLVGGASLDPDEFVGIVRYRLLDLPNEE